MKKPGPGAILGPVSNPLPLKYLKRGAWATLSVAALACSHKPPPQQEPKPEPIVALPTGGLAGQKVIVLPFTLLAAEDSLGWDKSLADHRATLLHADSILGALLQARVPEVTWLLPDVLRRAARRAPGIAVDPDQMATAVLRVEKLTIVPDPLRSQLRTLAALSTGGDERYALAPAALIYRRPHATAGTAASPPPPPAGAALGELVMVLVDVRTGHVMWRTVARGSGADPWVTLTRAVKSFTPGLP